MKTRFVLALLPFTISLAAGQMPDSFDASGRSAQSQNGVSNDDPAHRGEQPNPQIFGMEIPLLDPASDTMSYNGGKFDVGNNALVRDRFEKYLAQTPDDTEEAKRYRKRMDDILKYTQRTSKSKSPVGGGALVKIGFALYEIAEYPADAGQANALASSIASALDVQRGNYRRDKENEQMDKDIARLKKQTNTLTNRNTMRREPPKPSKGPARASGKVESNTFTIGANTADIAEKKGKQAKNDAVNEANLLIAKTNYQALLMAMLAQRRFDHVVIGARTYRHLFKDGDTRLNINKDSDASKLFEGVSGMPPTVNAMDSLASEARRQVDQHIDAVHTMLAQNKLAAATQHLISAVALGEHMQSVTTFPAESRMRVSEYWTLRKSALMALNARDYGEVERVAARMKELDSDFQDSLLRTYCAGKKNDSNLCLRNARKALEAGNDEEFNRCVREAAIIWPTNPELEKAAAKLEELDSHGPEKADFRELYAAGEYRRIHDAQDKFRIVAIDPELRTQYEEVITLVKTIDVMLSELESAARQDRVQGPCIAYEKLLARKAEDSRYAKDAHFNDAVRKYENQAHDFVKALDDAKDSAARGEYGSALSSYYRALNICPASDIARKGVNEMSDIILRASF